MKSSWDKGSATGWDALAIGCYIRSKKLWFNSLEPLFLSGVNFTASTTGLLPFGTFIIFFAFTLLFRKKMCLYIFEHTRVHIHTYKCIYTQTYRHTQRAHRAILHGLTKGEVSRLISLSDLQSLPHFITPTLKYNSAQKRKKGD